MPTIDLSPAHTTLTAGQSPAVSVVVYIRQNDPAFLERSLDSILSQQTGFPFDIILLGDSRTAESVEDIGREYAAIYPEKVVFYPFPRRVGYVPFFPYDITVDSPYIVLCSDKEQWIDTGKLQEQYDFLQTHPTYAVCLHRITFLYGDGNMSASSYDSFGRDTLFSVGELSRLLLYRSAMFRIRQYPYHVHFMVYQKEGIGLFARQAVSGRLKILPETVSDVLLDVGERMEEVNHRTKIYLIYSR